MKRSSPSAAEPYEYSPLAEHGSLTRLVELLPADGRQIRCKMHVVEIDTIESIAIDNRQRTYEALSYTWQSHILTHNIVCDGRRLPITQNLHDALDTLQRPTTSRLLWIDAICINQSDNQERNHQVSLMRQIYNRAALVIAWIGKEDEDSRIAFRLVERIADKHFSAGGSLTASPEAIWDNQKMKSMDLPPFPSLEWEALAKLFENRYFRRIWVVQEIVVSKVAIIRCGWLTIKWEYVEFVARSLLSTGWLRALKDFYGPNVIPNFVQTIGNIKFSSSKTQGGRGIRLSRLLGATRRFEATDPRDKIIAIVGLADPRSLGESATALLDYSKPVPELYRDVTRYLMKNERSLTLLSSVEDMSDTRFNDLPSWVPDYSVWQKHTVLGLTIGVTHLGFRPGWLTHPTIRHVADPSVLLVNGIDADEVSTVSQNSLEHRTRRDFKVILEWLELAQPLISRGTIAIETFWRALIGDQGKRIHPAPEQYGTHFEGYLAYAKKQEEELRYTMAGPHPRTVGNGSDLASLPYQAALGYVAPHRKFFTTRNGLVGLGPKSIAPGDRVSLLAGGRVPFILRSEDDRYRLVGESYVHGLEDSNVLKNTSEAKEFLIH